MDARLLLVTVLLLLAGCTSMSAIKSKTADLGTQIRSGHVVAHGDNVEIVTTDGQQHRFRVTTIDETTVNGSEISVPIDTIAELKVRKFDEGKTAGLIGGITATVVGLWLLAVSAMVIALA
jgi:hypothetical protein